MSDHESYQTGDQTGRVPTMHSKDANATKTAGIYTLAISSGWVQIAAIEAASPIPKDQRKK
jgi:hypothetical protein